VRAVLPSTDSLGQTAGAQTQSSAERHPERTRKQAVPREVFTCGREHLQGRRPFLENRAVFVSRFLAKIASFSKINFRPSGQEAVRPVKLTASA
jgi:hypothetical protein